MQPITSLILTSLCLLLSLASHASQFDAELLRLTNAERSQRGLSALTLNSQLGQAAQNHAADMAQQNYFSHTGQNGSSMGDRIKATGYSYAYAGENIAAGQQTPAAVLNSWMNSQGHRENILNPNFTEIGFGYSHSTQSDYGHYWVQVFGKPMNSGNSSGLDDAPFSGGQPSGLTEQQKAEALFNRIERDYQLVANSATISANGMYYRFYLNYTAGLIVYQNTFYLGQLIQQTWQFVALGSLNQANQQYCQSSCW
jgi:hypothetical protein